MAEPIILRAQLRGEVTDIKILISHPMETGQRKDAEGNAIPAHFIQQVTVTLNGKTLLTTQWGTAIARNPFLGLRTTAAKLGDKIAVTWTDTKGEQRTDETTVTAAPV